MVTSVGWGILVVVFKVYVGWEVFWRLGFGIRFVAVLDELFLDMECFVKLLVMDWCGLGI